MLAGPELFFQRGKCILPWHDDPDSPIVSQKTSRAVTKPQEQEPASLSESFLCEASPHSALPSGWQSLPKTFGVTIRVSKPSLNAGLILSHCKD